MNGLEEISHFGTVHFYQTVHSVHRDTKNCATCYVPVFVPRINRSYGFLASNNSASYFIRSAISRLPSGATSAGVSSKSFFFVGEAPCSSG
jgi:hypothetical protein